jgi:Fe-S-cluster-containing hydrogenase component 2
MRKDDVAACGHCEACKQVCPVHAISTTGLGATVDREACMNVVIKKGGECFECLLACRRSILSVVPFTRADNGEIVQE